MVALFKGGAFWPLRVGSFTLDSSVRAELAVPRAHFPHLLEENVGVFQVGRESSVKQKGNRRQRHRLSFIQQGSTINFYIPLVNLLTE